MRAPLTGERSSFFLAMRVTSSMETLSTCARATAVSGLPPSRTRARSGNLESVMSGETHAARSLAALVCALLASCGSAPPSTLPRVTSRVIDVRVAYASRHDDRPARLVRVVVRARSNRVAWEGRTDRDGRAAIPLPPDARWLSVEARIDAPGAELAVTRDGLGQHAYRVRARVPRGDRLELRIAGEQAARFAALDTMLEGIEAASGWTHRRFPPLFAASSDAGTAYSPSPLGLAERRYRILLAPDDAADASVVLHEVGHFVLHQLDATTASGGPHSTSVVVSPGLAWDEGCATWFSAVVRGEPIYEDTLADGGACRVDLEHRGPRDPPDRLDSEATVQRVLWDLVDGTSGLDDEDGDGVAITPKKLLAAMSAIGDDREMVASLSALLYALVERNTVRPDALAHVLARTSAPTSLAVERREDLWPPLIRPGDSHGDTLLGFEQLTPDGARVRLAQHVVRVRVSRPGLLRVRVSLAPDGDREDLVRRVARNAGVPVSRAEPLVRRFVDEHDVLVSLSLANANGERLHVERLEAGTYEHVRFVRHPGDYLVSLRQLEIVPARYEISAELDAL